MKTKNTPQIFRHFSPPATCWMAMIASTCLLASSVLAADGTWNANSGSWGVAGNWLPVAVAGGTSSIVNFRAGAGGFANRTVTLDGDRTVGIMNIDQTGSNGTYTIASGTGGSLTFDNGGSNAQLNFDGIFDRTISAPVILNSSLDIDSSGASNRIRYLTGAITAGGADTAKVITNSANVGGSQLRLNGTISDGADARVISLHQNTADGFMYLGGANTFSGGVRVSAGTLILPSGNAPDSEDALGIGTLTLDGGNLQFIGFNNFNYGNTTEISADTNINLQSAATSAKTRTLGALSVGNHIVTVDNTNSTTPTTSEDTLVFGATTLTGNATFSVQTVTAVETHLTFGALNGAFNLTKTGNGILELGTAAGSYSGTTTLNAGTMIVGDSTALGSGNVVMSGTAAASLQIGSGITTANDITYSNTNASSAIERVVSGSSSFNVGSTGALTSDFVGGTDHTTAALRAGSGATTLTMSFAPTATASNDGSRISDVFNLSLSSSETYVLQLSTGVVGSDNLFLGWLDGGSWVEATTGNTGAGGLAGQYASTWDAFLAGNGGSFDSGTMLGAYGYDETTSTAWAVLNHNSEFALVVPEPSTVVLCGLGLSFMLFRLRTRR